VDEALKAAIETAQVKEQPGHVVGLSLDLLRDILAGRATHAAVNSFDQVMRIRLTGGGS
jgi:hypothetical protein